MRWNKKSKPDDVLSQHMSVLLSNTAALVNLTAALETVTKHLDEITGEVDRVNRENAERHGFLCSVPVGDYLGEEGIPLAADRQRGFL